MTNKLSAWLLYFIAAVSGAAVMAVEISSSRLLAPFFGASLFVWTNIIGGVMVALALGYYLGGRLADRWQSLRVILRILFCAGLVFFIVPDVVRLVARAGAESVGAELSFSVGMSFGLSLLALGLPLMLLGMVPPFLTKIYSRQEQVGRAAGSISAFSTLGSVIGTYLPATLLIPAYGTKATIQIFAASLVLLGVLGFWPAGKKIFSALMLAGLFAVFSLSAGGVPGVSSWGKIIFTEESPYQYIRVAENAAGTRYLLYNQGWGSQSSFAAAKILTGAYYDYYNLLPYYFAPGRKAKVLLLGLAGGTALRQLNYFFPGNVELSAVEIDGKSIEVAREFFGLDSVPAKLINADGRSFVEHDRGYYDIILVDVFQNEYEIPWHMTTAEFWQKVSARLSPQGFVAMNAVGSDSRNGLQASIANTLAKVFPTVYVTPLSRDRLGNYLLTACACDFAFSDLKAAAVAAALQPHLSYVLRESRKIDYRADVAVLTDDRAPVEVLTARMLLGAGRQN